MKKLLLCIIITISSFSCTKNDESIDNKSTTSQLHKLSHDEIIAAKNMMLISESPKKTTSSIPIEKKEDPLVVYSEVLNAQNMTLQIDSRLLPIADNTYEQNIDFLKSKNIIGVDEIKIIDDLKNQIESTSNFEKSIEDFENSILKLPLSNDKKQKYINFIDGLKILNQMEPDLFKDTLTAKSSLFGTCKSATIGLGLAFVGLATIEVGSFGLATGVAVAGFIWASAEWGKACKGTYKKGTQLPAPVKRTPTTGDTDTRINFITVNDNEVINPTFIIKYSY